MKNIIFIVVISTSILACKGKPSANTSTESSIQGTWQLFSGSITEKGTHKTTEYEKNFSMIKIINNDHFAFLKRSLNPKDSTGFDAGGGSYTLKNDNYVEHLEYYKDKNWEGKVFEFKIIIKNDTLIQSGIEKVENTNIDRLIVEKYIRKLK